MVGEYCGTWSYIEVTILYHFLYTILGNGVSNLTFEKIFKNFDITNQENMYCFYKVLYDRWINDKNKQHTFIPYLF